ncbi:MAG: hypothetical protein MPJ50_01945 [Pirellulales bacterium]|nr:hypothetical protein [Pirellulales bacterium]
MRRVRRIGNNVPAANGQEIAGSPCSRRTLLAGLAGSLSMLALQPSRLIAAPPVSRDPGGSSSARDRAAAIRAIPMNALDRAARQKVNAVLASITIFRRLPVQMFQCDPELYLFMIEHPDVTTNIWEVLGVSDVAIRKTGQRTFSANDGAGTKSDIEFLHVAPDTHLLYAVGSYDGSLFTRPVRGGALLLLKSGTIKDKGGRSYLTCRLDVFCRVDHLGVELTAKTFQGLVGKSADHNFVESISFLDQLSQAAAARSKRVLEIADQLDKVTSEDKQAFSRIVNRIGESSPAEPLPLQRMDALDGKATGLFRR